MKKTILISGFVLSTFLLAQGAAVSAAVTPVDYSSNATVTFTENTDPTDPVDPTDPDNPFEPENPAQPGTDGPLSIDYASSLDFGTQKITSVDKTYYAALTKGKDSEGADKSVPNYVQVTDNTGSNKGWELKVTQVGDFMNGSDALVGAQISFGSGNALTATNSNAGTPTATGSFDLVKDQEQVVTTAAADQGQGTWVTRYGNNETDGASAISLSVPGASTKNLGAYTTTLKWNLAQTPEIPN
ncbi:WxL domain-containing protein [Weissella muntiaci]|jgi:hypothetical protein|uniref:WxL domain-containing protein n=1 Tax=Weissella muntiaci TaxID=2508881 RepID=A0A6C2CCE4_9LACO|nr:WxL domain-containing protein [Weissella muntiaci]TYC50825.1 WxL domain-containing protein [Weissella muntiaci]